MTPRPNRGRRPPAQPVGTRALSWPGATGCSARRTGLLWQLAALASAATLLALGGCGSESGASGGLDPAVPGSLSVTVDGLPPGAPAGLTLTGPGGFTRTVSASGVVADLDPGIYQLAAAAVSAAGDGYQPAPVTQSISVKPGPAVAAAQVTYVITTGRILLTVAGLPAGAAPAVTLEGPDGFTAGATAAGEITGLPPGTYTVRAEPVQVDGDEYRAVPDAIAVLVTPGQVPSPATVSYVLATGRLDLTVTGVPDGSAASVLVSGPDGFSQTVGASTLLTGLEPGDYTVAGPPVSTGGHRYDATVTPAAVTVAATATPAAVAVAYAVATGALTVEVTGLPGATAAAVVVTGPGGFQQTLTGPAAIVGLEPGAYTISAASVAGAGATWVPNPASQVINLPAGTAPVVAAVAYAKGIGSLDLTVNGLPGGTAGSLTISGPNGFAATPGGSIVLSGLDPGSYTIAAAPVSSGGQTWNPSPASQVKAVTTGATTAAAVTYTPVGGSLSITVTGLPGGVAAAVGVTGPGGYNHATAATETLTGLVPGSYTVGASSVTSGGSTYNATPTSQPATVTAGSTSAVSVNYAVAPPPPPPPPPPTSFNLVVDGMYLTQATQRYDGSVPLVAGRDAYLRIFVKANQANAEAPAVRVRFYSGSTLLQTITIPAPGGSVPTTIAEGTLASSWNVAVPAAMMQPNLAVLVDVDPTNGILESSDADNTFPATGTPGTVDIRSLATFNVRFVPVLQQVNGLQGNVTTGNQAQYLVDVLKLLPIATIDADLHAVYTTTAPALESGNGNGAWSTILSEIRSLKVADGSNRYYYGVVKTTYSSGVAGIGYVGWGANSALGWDRLPSGSGVMAHELGHNMGRPHAPCGGVANPDPGYPHSGGQIGVYGLDLATLTIKQPTTVFDLMTYCSPEWVSDYNWEKMVQYRESNPSYAPPIGAGAGAGGLLVWGRAGPGGVVLEPAFRVQAPVTRAARSSRYRVEGLAADGSVLFSYPVDAVPVTDGGGSGEEHVSAVLPIGPAVEARVAALRLVTPWGAATRRSSHAAPGPAIFMRDPGAALSRPNALQATVRWDGAAYPMALVRDAATGQILSFARGGQATVWTRAAALDVVFSDGVRSRAGRLTP